ncbi:hypothetical protein MHU86_6856 [Fragilaria crotonensis]|nr:hypothetical protein MHU86_6856 [Fragilaria crotonensis]
MDMSSTNKMPALKVGIGLQASNSERRRRRVAKHSETANEFADSGKETLTISTASPPDEAGESSAQAYEAKCLARPMRYKARLPLVSLYGTVIHPTDTSLNDARKRLRKALDQTRILRAAFTDRVYEKYKVILRPVPDCVDTLIAKISADPIVRKSQLMEEIRAIKEEKELEKKEAQTLATAGIFNGITGKEASTRLTSYQRRNGGPARIHRSRTQSRHPSGGRHARYGY